MSLFSNNVNRLEFKKLEERISKLEEKAYKNSRKDLTTVRQQLLILHHLGILDNLNDLKLSREKKAKLLSILLNGSFDNIRGYLSEINKKESQLKTGANYKFLVETFKEIGLKKFETEADKILDEIAKIESEQV